MDGADGDGHWCNGAGGYPSHRTETTPAIDENPTRSCQWGSVTPRSLPPVNAGAKYSKKRAHGSCGRSYLASGAKAFAPDACQDGTPHLFPAA